MDRIKAHRSAPDVYDPPTFDQMADRIDQTEAKLAKAVEALREISAEASVTVHTWKNGINFKKMYEGWRKIAVQKIDVARAALAELEGK
jgi:uncharacterized protein YkwD